MDKKESFIYIYRGKKRMTETWKQEEFREKRSES